MKKTILLSALLSLFAFNGCKKDKPEADITTFFNNTEWAGEIKYNNQSFAQPYHIRFYPNGDFVWSQVEGLFGGSYTIDKATKAITLNFYAGILLKAVVTTDKKLTNFSYGGTYPYTIYDGEMVSTSTQSLDNTVWVSKETTPSGATVNSTFNFLPGATMKYGTSLFPGVYTRFGAAIRYTYPGLPSIFLVLIREDKMIGTWVLPGFDGTKVELTKK